jgi:hypothetical protein
VFDVNDGSRDHSISLADFKRSLVHMDIHLPDIVANQVERMRLLHARSFIPTAVL